MAVNLPTSHIDLPSTIFLQIFDSRFSVKAFDQQTYTRLCLAQQAVNNAALAKKLLIGIADTMKHEDIRNLERTISNVEYNARILEQNLSHLASRSSLHAAYEGRNRTLQTVDGGTADIFRSLEDLSDASGLLHSLLVSYTTIQHNIMLKSKMDLCRESETIQEIVPHTSTQPLQANGLPAFDPRQLLHHRRKSRIGLRDSQGSFQRYEMAPATPSGPRNSPGECALSSPQVMVMHELDGSSTNLMHDDRGHELSSNESRMYSGSDLSSAKGDAVIELIDVQSLNGVRNPPFQTEQHTSLRSRPGSAKHSFNAKPTVFLNLQHPLEEDKITSATESRHLTPARGPQDHNSSNIPTSPASSKSRPSRPPSSTKLSTTQPVHNYLGHRSLSLQQQKFPADPDVFHTPEYIRRPPTTAAGHEEISGSPLPLRPVRKRNAWLLHQIDKAGYSHPR